MGAIEASRAVEVEAPVERCFEIVSDLARTPEWQQSMISLDVLESDEEGRPTLCEVVSDAKVKHARSRLRFAHHPPDRLTWEQEEGDMKWLRGSWSLKPAGDDRTRAVYSLESDPGRMLGMLLRGPVEGKVKEFLTRDAAEGLKRRAEGG